LTPSENHRDIKKNIEDPCFI